MRGRVRRTAAADEVDDFEAVAVFEMSLRPAIAGDDVAIEFDGYAVGLHGQGFDQGCEREVAGRCFIREYLLFSIDVKNHFIWGKDALRALSLQGVLSHGPDDVIAALDWTAEAAVPTSLHPPGRRRYDYSALRNANLRVTVRPWWLACTITEASAKADSSTSTEIWAAPAESVTA